MKKIEAVEMLTSKKCDIIVSGSSEFILDGDSIVNRRSKKALDLKGLYDSGWEPKSLPKWYDSVPGGAILAVLPGDGHFVVIDRLETIENKTVVYTQDGVAYNPDLLEPASKEAALKLVYSASRKKTPSQKAKTDTTSVCCTEEDVSKSDTLQSSEVMPEISSEDKATCSDKKVDLTVDKSTDDVSVKELPKQKEEECQVPKSKSTQELREEAARKATVSAAIDGISSSTHNLREVYENAGISKSEWHLFHTTLKSLGILIQDNSDSEEAILENIRVFNSSMAESSDQKEGGLHKELEALIEYGLEAEDFDEFIDFHSITTLTLDTLKNKGIDKVIDAISEFYEAL